MKLFQGHSSAKMVTRIQNKTKKSERKKEKERKNKHVPDVNVNA